MKLNDYCGNSRLCLILPEYQPVIQKSHIHQGDRVNIPCVFANTAMDSPSFIKMFFGMECGSEAMAPRTDRNSKHRLQELIYSLFPLSYANWKASKAFAI